MSIPYVGEIRMFAYFRGAPLGWQLCNGALLPISENETLFSLIGTTYGGDGQETFAVPDLRGRLPIHQGQGPGLSNYLIGQTGGVEEVTLTLQQVPGHTHPMMVGTRAGSAVSPAGGILAVESLDEVHSDATTGLVNMSVSAVGPNGGSQPHTNMMPYLVINFAISLFGIYPSPT